MNGLVIDSRFGSTGVGATFFFTVTFSLTVFLLALMVIVALPAFFPVTMPFLPTVATAFLDDVNVAFEALTVFSPSLSTSFSLLPTFNLALTVVGFFFR